ncbi:MAG: DUF5011 domain-containing protein [Sphingobacteriaceae bacterium]|nr:MAG: DUF5011 domain-containing protein [Sphingobacteriaceae bacterium]
MAKTASAARIPNLFRVIVRLLVLQQRLKYLSMSNFNTTKRLPATARNSLHKTLRRAALFLISGFAFTNAQAQLSGSYTIGGKSADFNSFSHAVDSLQQVGVSGAVEFKVAAGTYNEQILIPDISGTSSSNTITFKGAGAGKGGTNLTFAVSGFSGAVVQVDNANNIIFKNLLIQQTDCGDSRFSVYLNGASNITFENCHLQAPDNVSCSNLGSSWGINALHMEGSANNTFHNNRISGGTTTIESYYYGSAYDVFDNNKIVGGFYNTINLYGGEGLEFTHNTIDSAYYFENRALVIESFSAAKVAYNNFVGTNLGSAMAFNDINTNSNAVPTEVYNNMMNVRSQSMRSAVSINYWTSSAMQADFIFAHNTINVPNAQNGEALYVQAESISGIKILNNIITRTKTGLALNYVFPHIGNVVDGNNFYNAASGDLIQYANNTYSNIADYKTDAINYGDGLYDQSMKVTYKSSTDLHISQTVAAPWGPATNYMDDMDGDKRCVSFATAGADESKYTGNDNYKKPKSPSFSVPSTVYYKNPVSFENNAAAGLAEKYMWYINGVFVIDSVHLAAALEGPTDEIKLVAYNCGSKDSMVTKVSVKMPTSAPITDFISDRSVIRQGQVVKLFDISANYPSEWTWEITPREVFKNESMVPAYEFVHGDETTQNLYVRFLYGGKYTVCFTASNVVGSGNKECISDFIEVMSSANLGGGITKLTDAEGYIYDNGGPDKPYNYGDPSRDKMVIGECADSVYLVFKKFDVACDQNYGDYVRVFEGTNNRGRELHCTNNRSTWGPGPGLTGSPTSSCATLCTPISATHIDTFKAKGNMYIEMESNVTGNEGFEAYYWIKPKTQLPPVAKFVSLDSVCINAPIAFKNESTGDDIKYLWDADDDGYYEAMGENISWIYFSEGQYNVNMIAMNCGGADTFTKTINVFLPTTPVVQFTADNTTPSLDETVFLTSDVAECVDDYMWTFTPSSGKGEAIFMNGTSETSANPNVMFTDTGCYSVVLHVSNANGEDELKLNCFIHVKQPYCKPTVKTLSQDIGISEVVFGDFSNKSTQAETAYSNFVNNASKAITAENDVTYNVTIKRNTTKLKVTRTIWIDYNFDGVFDNTTEKVAENVNSDAKEWSTTIKIPANVKVGATIMRVAVNQGSYTNKVCGKNEFGEFEDYRLYIRADITKPVITLIGDQTIMLEQGESYTDEGATAFDNHDGDITSDIIVTEPKLGYEMIPGTYYFRYNVKDAAENEAVEVLRTVIIGADKMAPELVVAGGDTTETIVYSATSFTPPTVTRANDLVDGDVSGLVKIVNPVKMSVVDTYQVVYTVMDRAKNEAKKVITVIVKDTTKPVITLLGDNPYKQNIGDAYVDAGVTMTDNYYAAGTLNDALQTTSNVNINAAGEYEVIYAVKDGSGNLATVTRKVIVGDMVPPVVSIIGDTMIIMEVKTRFQDLGFNATDNSNSNIIKQTAGSFYANFPNGIPTRLDTFTVVYTATDMGSNSTSRTRYIVVKDLTEPVISLKGTPNATVCRWGAYTDAGYDVEDNFYATTDITITTEGDWNVNSSNVEGPYSLRYKAVDKSGNIGYSDWRTIWVRSPYEFPCSTNVSIGDVKALEKAISIYPNPNSGKFTVQADMPKSEKLKFTVTNLLGQEVAVITDETMNENKFQVDLSNQPAGAYLLNITSAHHTTTKRIVISK